MAKVFSTHGAPGRLSGALRPTALRPALVLLALLSLLTGLVYPLAVSGVAGLVFPRQAAGSLITEQGKIVGSELIGQPFDDPKYFWGRLSATPGFPNNAAQSSGSNFGPMNPALRDAAAARIAALRAADPAIGEAGIPVDLVTASASGLDPHISPFAAMIQVGRVAAARGLDPSAIRALVTASIEEPLFGIWGQRRVNVLRLNLALDALGAR